MSGTPAAGDDPIRVALLSPCFWPEVRRGTERIVRELADGLVARGHSPRLITSHAGPATKDTEDGLEVVRNRRPPGSARLQRRLFEDHLTHVPASYRSLAAGDDDIAHATYPTDGLAAVAWARQRDRPAILSYMGIPERPWLSERRGRIAITRRAMRGSAAVVMVSRVAAEACRRWLGIDARVIPPGVDLETFRPDPGGRTEVPTLFCATSAVDEPRKRIGFLIEAFRIVRRERPDARLVIVEPGQRDSAVGQAARRAEGVELLGSNDLAPVYAGAWASILPSIGDSFGIVLAESLACGTPVVGAQSGAIPEIAGDEATGRLFEPDDERGLAAAVLEAFELSQDSATTEACLRRAQEFSTDRQAERYIALYRELLAG